MTTTLSTKSLADKVGDQLRSMIENGDLQPGDQIIPIRKLATRFEVSVPTVLRAIKQLDADGLLERRRGSGTYVREVPVPPVTQRAVTLAIEVGGDIFGDLADSLSDLLHEQDCAVGLVNTTSARTDDLLIREATSDHGCLVLHGTPHVMDRLREVDFGKKTMVAVMDWETWRDSKYLTKVLCDHEAGMRAVVDHLWELGHRHVLIAGTKTQISSIEMPWYTFSPLPRLAARLWQERGGRISLLPASELPDRVIQIDEDEWLERMGDPETSPTAVIGLRDAEAHCAQRMIRRYCPERQAHIAIVGYYDTPWSSAGAPPITSVNLNIPEVARLAAEAIASRLDGKPIADALVAPRLVIRETSNPLPK